MQRMFVMFVLLSSFTFVGCGAIAEVRNPVESGCDGVMQYSITPADLGSKKFQIAVAFGSFTCRQGYSYLNKPNAYFRAETATLDEARKLVKEKREEYSRNRADIQSANPESN